MNEDELYKINEEDYVPPVKVAKKGIRKRCRITDQQVLKRKFNNMDGYSMISSIYFDEYKDRYRRFYISGRKKVAKYCTNRKLRSISNKHFPMKCGNYRLYFDYWWTVW